MNETFYDITGSLIAYIEDGKNIYLFSGEPVGYLDNDSIYSFSWKHLGWFIDGWIFDHSGGRVFFSENSIGGPVKPMIKLRPLKHLKQLKPLKSIKQLKPLKPIKQLMWSNISGIDFFDK